VKVTLSSFSKLGLPFPQNHRTLHGKPLLKNLQLPFGNGELSEAAMQTDQKLWKDPHDRFVQSFESREVNRNLTIEGAMVG
jgi:hypothetical protein